MRLWTVVATVLLAAAGAACDATVIVGSPTAMIAVASPSPTATVGAPSVTPEATASEPSLPSAEATLPPSPYTFTIDDIVQEPGTILFGDTHRGTFDTFLGWPYGISMDWDYSYGAYWGEPLGDDRIRVTLYRVRNGTLSKVWSDVKRIDSQATGYLDSIVRFAAPGVYRLEVTRGVEPIASSLIRVGPPCTENCSGG